AVGRFVDPGQRTRSVRGHGTPGHGGRAVRPSTKAGRTDGVLRAMTLPRRMRGPATRVLQPGARLAGPSEGLTNEVSGFRPATQAWSRSTRSVAGRVHAGDSAVPPARRGHGRLRT